MEPSTDHLWTAFAREALAGGSFENVALDPGASLHARLLDPSSPGLLVAPPIRRAPFDRAIVSWNGSAPPGGRLELDVRAWIAERWTQFYPLAVWSSTPEGPRHSIPGHGDADGGIETDTLRLTRCAEALQICVRLVPGTSASPVLTGLAAILSDSRRTVAAQSSSSAIQEVELEVPRRSQQAFAEGARSWCSPVSVTMVLEYWGKRLGRPLADPVPLAALLTWDSAYQGAGNWPFNTAYASTKGLRACVTRLADLAEAAGYLRRSVPLVLSIGWDEGQLEGAHLPASRGHLVVLRGFTAEGDPIVNDPAAPDETQVRTIFPRASFEQAWLGHSGGIAYLIEP